MIFTFLHQACFYFQVAALEKKDQEEEEAKLNLRQQAKKELDDWYRQHAEQVYVRRK